VQSDKFDLVFSSFPSSVPFGCTCKAEGKVDDPDFNASKEFLYVNPVSSTVAEAIGGKVSGNGKKIKGGFFGDGEGGSGLFECELDPTCTPTL
jgi:hypothetical protein